MSTVIDEYANGVVLVKNAYSSAPDADDKRTALLEFWCFVEAGMNSDRDLEIANEAPGYLVAQTKDCGNFFVPVNLVRVSPTVPQREEIRAISEDLKLREDFEMCLSGSATFLGVTAFLGDIDFAEYFAPPHESILRGIGILSNSPSYPTLRIEWIQAYFSKGSRRKSLRRRMTGSSDVASEVANSGWRKIQVGAWADLRRIHLGGLELTNMVVPVSRPTQTSQASFVHQEIVLTEPEKIPPRSLANREQIVGYFEFLIAQGTTKLEESIKFRCEKRAAKALKRCLALIMLLSDRVLFQKGLELLPLDANEPFDLESAQKYSREVLRKACQVRRLYGATMRAKYGQ